MSPKPYPLESVNAQIWRVQLLLEESIARPRSGHRVPELEAYFAQLADTDAETRAAAEQQIWSVWCDHPVPVAKAEMADGISHLSGGRLKQGEAVFDRLVEQYPTWAEAWNKRATVLFLRDLDARSVMDIHQTLELEPRHFGALGGFAQICVRNGAREAAVLALSRLLEVNPHAPGIADAIASLGDDTSPVLH